MGTPCTVNSKRGLRSSGTVMWSIFLIFHLNLLAHVTKADDSVPDFDCDFDMDLCGWNADLTGAISWTRLSGPTPTPDTGPSSDHTSGSGFYLYTEAGDQDYGAMATLISPSIPALGTDGACVTFWYHMLGSTMGKLFVYNPENNERWTKSGNQGNVWLQANAWLEPSSDATQVFITGMIGGKHYSDIAIDDVMIHNGYVCEESSPGPHDCDFEADLCAWNQDIDNDIDWTRASGPTGTAGTGPAADHTKGDETGYYIYVEPIDEGSYNTARLVSDTILNSDDNGTCMEFWYYMSGTFYETITVYKWIVGPSDQEDVMWQEDQSRGPQWNQVLIHFTDTDYYQVTFEVETSYSSTAEVALDDIVFHDGKCKTPDQCTFENDDCSYIPGSGSDFDWTLVEANSGGSIPPTDVTYNSAEGHMLFADLSSLTSNSLTGIVETGYLDSTDADGRCFQFWYYMGTSGVSVLMVYMETEVGQRTMLWEMDGGTHADEWHVQETNLINPSSRMKVSFEASTTDFNQGGGIAVDEIWFEDSPCSPFGSCDFENSYCTWKNDRQDDELNWQRIRGPTPGEDTGADVDHTYGTAADDES
ncbi:MAM and LDL-receptor class A domain-containing protein 1-like [Strongylocentrotus purpuratus]|uniref:MAM domain-containing protein n=1 Tax=Strongylocentrotus purpuratus TaxID=7668 RepID=A0A7M7PE35_STRPU|nr:MAM and LDL-receptor class A domain-containing protein 1-like [Strongylocentrotus purpuratus]